MRRFGWARPGGRGHRVMGGAGGASRTAILVCQGRAVAHGRLAPGRFDDPTALALLRPAERVVVEQVRADAMPVGAGPRMAFEMVRACGDAMAPRTVTIDDAVREVARHSAPGTQVVILGAGLDGRAWHLRELAGIPVFEVDHPATQREKRERAGGLAEPVSAPVYVPVDFSRDDLGDALAAAGHRESAPTVWIWEGVVPYLTRGQTLGTLQVIAARSAPGSRLIIQYHSPTPGFALGRGTAAVLSRLTGSENPMAREPNRSAWTPRAMGRAVAAGGFTVTRDDTLLVLARRFDTPARHRQSLRGTRILVADRPASGPSTG